VAKVMSQALGFKLCLEPEPAHETAWLHLDSSKAKRELAWHPVFTTQQAVTKTATWYRAFLQGHDVHQLTQEHIQEALQKAQKGTV
jgi:CDP-glucose 4,6-dehydratase